MYLAKIEEYFFKYRRQGTILSPQNWLIAERWEQMGIPIHIVCKGIKETCRKFRSTHQEGEERIDMLTYCEPKILKLWKDHKKALLGSPNRDGKNGTGVGAEQQPLADVVRKRLKYIRKDLSSAATGSGPGGDLKAEALAKLDWTNELDIIENEHCKDDHVDIEAIESRLANFDKAYLSALFRLLSKQQKAEWTDEVEEELSSYKKQMDEESYRETLELGIESLLRERFNMRRISLYAT